MAHRGVQIAVIVFWLVSMTWLVATKIVPTLGAAVTPDQRTFLPEAAVGEETVVWRIRWQGQTIGQATTVIRKDSTGHGKVVSEVHFDELPAGQIMAEAIESLGMLAKLLPAPDAGLKMSMTADSVMKFDPFGQLEGFRAAIRLATLGELVRLTGDVRGGQLRITAIAGDGISFEPTGDRQPMFQQSVTLPPDALLADSMAPQSRLAGLRVGQTWQFRTYRAFPPNDPYRLVEACVERQEMIAWEDDVEPCYVVAFSDLGGSGVTSTQSASSRLWVREDGTVLRQQMQVGSATVEFVRAAEKETTTP